MVSCEFVLPVCSLRCGAGFPQAPQWNKHAGCPVSQTVNALQVFTWPNISLGHTFIVSCWIQVSLFYVRVNTVCTFRTELKDDEVLLSTEGSISLPECVKAACSHYCGCSQTSEAARREDPHESILNSGRCKPIFKITARTGQLIGQWVAVDNMKATSQRTFEPSLEGVQNSLLRMLGVSAKVLSAV